MKKRILTVAVLGLTLVLSGCGCESKKITPPEPPITVPEEVTKDQTVDVFHFESTSLVYEKGESSFETIVTNTSDTVQELKEFKIIIKKNEEVLAVMTGFVGSTLKPQESKTISSRISKNLTDATAIEYEVTK